MSEARKAEYRETFDALASNLVTVVPATIYANIASDFLKKVEETLEKIPEVIVAPKEEITINVAEGIEHIALIFDAEIYEKLTGEDVCLEVKIPGTNVSCYQFKLC